MCPKRVILSVSIAESVSEISGRITLIVTQKVHMTIDLKKALLPRYSTLYYAQDIIVIYEVCTIYFFLLFFSHYEIFINKSVLQSLPLLTQTFFQLDLWSVIFSFLNFWNISIFQGSWTSHTCCLHLSLLSSLVPTFLPHFTMPKFSVLYNVI